MLASATPLSFAGRYGLIGADSHFPGNLTISKYVFQEDAGREVETSHRNQAPCCLPGGRGNSAPEERQMRHSGVARIYADVSRYRPPVSGHAVGA